MYKLIIFDLDGTLINSIDDLADAVNYGLNEMGYEPHETERFKTFVGNGAVKLCERALKKYTSDTEQIKKLHELFSVYYDAHCMDKTYAYDGIKELLDKLKNKNISLAVASNKPHEFTKILVEKIFGKDIFKVIMGKSDKLPAKPAPDIIHEIIKKADAKASQTIMIGDSDVDIMTAHNASISSIGCTWGFRTKTELINAGADFIVDTPSEIENII
ncbi:MAG: HAD family hydrolase [Ruminococcus sp.]|nr:HAD family hydrolase [Ruminococcus sp.]